MINSAPLAQVIDMLLDAVCVVDADGHFLFVSAAFERIFGYRPDEILGRQMLELVHPDDHGSTLSAVARIVGGVDEMNFENRYLHKQGHVVQIMWSARWSPDHRIRVAVARDVTKRKRAEAMQAALYAISEAAHAALDLATLCRRIGDIVAPLVAFADLRVFLPHEERWRPDTTGPRDGWHAEPSDAAAVSHALALEVVASGAARSIEAATGTITGLDQSGDAHPIEWLGLPLRAHGHVVGSLLCKAPTATPSPTVADLELLDFAAAQVASAIERKHVEAQLRHGAGHDSLTGLPNRNLVRDRMTAALALARREGTGLSLLYLDIDRFKEVNDRLGHGAGDALLQEMARRLCASVRDSDTVGRIGGDEFVVILQNVREPDDARSVAELVRTAACAPFVRDGLSLTATVSVGLAGFPRHGDAYESLLERADEAMYRSKKDGGDRVTVARAPEQADRR